LPFDHLLDEAKCKCSIRSGPQGQPRIRLLGQSNGPGIYHYEFRSSGTPIGDNIRLHQPGIRRIEPPDDRIGVFEVSSWKPATKGEGVGEILMPVAYLRGVTDVRAPEVPREAFDPINAVRDRRAARASNPGSYCFSAVLLTDRCELQCRFGECFLPTNTLPYRALCAFRVS